MPVSVSQLTARPGVHGHAMFPALNQRVVSRPRHPLKHTITIAKITHIVRTLTFTEYYLSLRWYRKGGDIELAALVLGFGLLVSSLVLSTAIIIAARTIAAALRERN
jgi:hypothetical protein